MQSRMTGTSRIVVMLLVIAGVTACTDTQEAPPFVGPSGLAQSLTLAASPDRLPHDGQSQSVVTVSMSNDQGDPLASQRVAVSSTVGTLSHGDVFTGSDGRATFIVTAPGLSTPAATISIRATPFGTNADSALTRTVTITLTGPLNTTAPSPSFTVAPATPVTDQDVVFDASLTTDEGSACTTCTFNWTFGDGETGSGRIVVHNFTAAGAYVVTLTVLDSAGTSASTQRSLTVTPAPVVTPVTP